MPHGRLFGNKNIRKNILGIDRRRKNTSESRANRHKIVVMINSELDSLTGRCVLPQVDYHLDM